MVYAKISREFFSADHRLPGARRKVFLWKCLGSMYAQKQTASCGILRVKFKKCEWVEVVCSNKARLVGRPYTRNRKQIWNQAQKKHRRLPVPQTENGPWRGSRNDFLKRFSEFSTEKERRNILCTTLWLNELYTKNKRGVIERSLVRRHKKNGGGWKRFSAFTRFELSEL